MRAVPPSRKSKQTLSESCRIAKAGKSNRDVRAVAKKQGCSRSTIQNVLNTATSRHLGARSSQATGDTFHVVQRRENEDRSDNQPSSAIRGRLLRDRHCGHHRRSSALGGCSCRDHRRRDSDGCRDIAEAVPTVVSFFDADAAARQDLLNKLRGSTVSAACSAYYALTDTEFC
ncbi:hypothetical protein JG688_00015161 [Phytophthora aleatoria]|uniref:Uncharacterized protein n=1 Tax=Phytophthora aleatoria TaxID=2496075 RepID=A0A8J5IKC5_9STRA|nr:hypothetical protein JG688_00015161 [Phytophthora aleatoria]